MVKKRQETLFLRNALGKEFSMMSLYNPNGVIYHLPPIKDYKRRFNGNSGPIMEVWVPDIDKNNT